MNDTEMKLNGAWVESKHSVLIGLNEQELVNKAGNLQERYPEGVDAEWMTSRIDQQLEMMQSQGIGLVDRAFSYLNRMEPEAKAKLARMRKRFDGSEVQDQQMLRMFNWVKQLQAQREFYEECWATEAELAQAKIAYREYFGKQWVPYSASDAAKLKEQKATTATAAAVDELLGEAK